MVTKPLRLTPGGPFLGGPQQAGGKKKAELAETL